MTTITVNVKGLPAFEFDVYFAEKDSIPVVHVDTSNLTEDSNGPLCRVYLNDDCIYENPKYKEA